MSASLYLTIDGNTYDVGSFAEDHPGGAEVLRDIARRGIDASAAFASNHSGNRARALLEKMPIVASDSETSSETSSSAAAAPTLRLAATAPPRQGPLWAVGLRGFLPARDPIARCSALEPLERCAALLPTACIERDVRSRVDREASAIGALLPLLVADGPLSEGELERAHALYGYVATAYVRASRQDGGELAAIPSFLAVGWCAVSSLLGRKPMVDYADCVLHNWQRVDASNPSIEIGNVRMLLRFTGLVDEEWFFKVHVVIEAAAANAIAALREGSDLVASVTNAGIAQEERATAAAAAASGSATTPPPPTFSFPELRTTATQLLLHLNALSDSLAIVVRGYLPKMFAQDEQGHGPMCDFYMFFHRLRPFIKSWDKAYCLTVADDALAARDEAEVEAEAEAAEKQPKKQTVVTGAETATKVAKMMGVVGSGTKTHDPASPPFAAPAVPEPRHYCGPSGAMSSLLPAVDAYVGIAMTNERLARVLADFETYTPHAHRTFVEKIRSRVTVRDCVAALVHSEVLLANNGGRGTKERSSSSDMSSSSGTGSSIGAALVSAFNRVVDVVLDFRWQHFQFVTKFVIEQAGRETAGTGGSPAFTYLHQHIDDTEKAKLSLPQLLAAARAALSREQASAGERATKSLPGWTYPPLGAGGSAAANEVLDALDYRQAGASAVALPASGLALDSSDERMWVPSVERGFLPRSAPRSWAEEPLPATPPCDALIELLALIPACASFTPSTFTAEVAKRADALSSFATEAGCVKALHHLPRSQLARVRMALAWVATAYFASSPASATASFESSTLLLPATLQLPLVYAAARLKRPARLCWTDLVSLNARLPRAVTLGDAPSRGAAAAAAAAASSDNAPFSALRRGRLLCRFVAVEEEESLWLTSAEIERAAGGIVDAARDCALAVAHDEPGRLVDALAALEAAICAVIVAHARLLPKKSGRAQKTAMRRVRRLLLAGGCRCDSETDSRSGGERGSGSAGADNGLAERAVREDLALARWLYAGESPLMQTLWAVLGVSKAPSALQRQRDAALTVMPRAHRRWVEALAAPDLSLRAFIARRAAALPVHTLALLEDNLKRCLETLLRLCSRRSQVRVVVLSFLSSYVFSSHPRVFPIHSSPQLVCRYLPAVASAFRGRDFAADKAVIDASFSTSLLRSRLGGECNERGNS